MNTNKKLLFSVALILIIGLVFGCSGDTDSIARENIEEFLNKKSELYDRKEKIIDIITLPLELEENQDDIQDTNSRQVSLDEELKDLRELLTEDEYNRLLENMYLIDQDFIDVEGNYNLDKSEIEEIEYKKISEDKGKIVYNVKYTEKLYSENEVKLEKALENEFTLEKIDDNWLISNIN